MKKTLKVLLPVTIVAIVFAIVACGSQPARRDFTGSRAKTPMRAGTYTEVVKGNAPGLRVEVQLSTDRIIGIRAVEHSDTPIIAQAAFDAMIPAIISQQSIDVDVVVGATLSSAGIRLAVENAITAAGGNPNDFRVRVGPADPRHLSRAAIRNPNGTPRGPSRTPSRWDETFDIIVVGGGYAGAAAAYAAKTEGASTVLIEKMAFIGGNSQINGGVWAAYTSNRAAELQALRGVAPDTAEKHIEDTIAGGGNLPIRELVENFVWGSPWYLNKLFDWGLVVRPALTMPGGHFGFRTYTMGTEQGCDITNIQDRMLKEANVDVRLNHKMVRIYQDQSGKAVGIAVYTADGIKTIGARTAVILATGGFSDNVAMRDAQGSIFNLNDAVPTTNQIGITGEGILYAQEIGAGVIHMEHTQLYPFADPNTGVLDVWAVVPFSGPSSGIVYVDYKGERYVNEGAGRDVNAIGMMESGGFPTFAIMDQRIVNQGGFTSTETMSNGIGRGINRVFRADTLEELAALLQAQSFRSPSGVQGNVNIPAGALTATINRHNQYITARNDPDFNKEFRPSHLTIGQPPFYAIPQWPSVHHTMGGLAVNNRMQVQNRNGQIIPGLYAAGEITGGIHGTNRLGSNAGPDAAVNGHIAGYYAATGRVPDFLRERGR